MDQLSFITNGPILKPITKGHYKTNRDSPVQNDYYCNSAKVQGLSYISCTDHFQIGSISSCSLVYVDDKVGQEALVLEHMSQQGWKDAFNKKKGRESLC